jgi:hypothetical protein
MYFTVFRITVKISTGHKQKLNKLHIATIINLCFGGSNIKPKHEETLNECGLCNMPHAHLSHSHLMQ